MLGIDVCIHLDLQGIWFGDFSKFWLYEMYK